MTHVFRGKTLVEARRAAEAELGDEVVVLEKRRVKRAGIAGMLGGTELEITAGVRVPPPPEEAEEDVRVELTEPPSKKMFARGVYEPTRESSSGFSSGDVEKLNAEVRAMRGMLHALKAGPNRIKNELATLRRAVGEIVPTSSPARLTILLSRSGIDGPLASELTRELEDHDGDAGSFIDAYRDALADRIRVRSWPLATDGRKVVAVVGAPGVGKTTTLAKLAGRAIGEGKSVSFVACDTYRVGAVEQLQRFAAMMGAPIEVATTRDELFAAVRASKSDIVFVDTSGRGTEDEGSIEAALANKTAWGDRARHVLLCTEAAARHVDSEQLVGRYRLSGPTGLVVTKIDLTSAPSGLVVGTVLTDLAVAVLCDGQRVPEDIAPATAGRILDLVAPHAWANSSRFSN